MQKLRIEDYQTIKPFLDCANYEGYNSNFVTMMMWDHEYHIEYEIHDHFMVMLQHYKGIRYFAMPFCEPKYYAEALAYMVEYAKNEQFPFMMDCVLEEVQQEIEKLYGKRFLYLRTAYNDDYIYEKQTLETLSGKKMQKRRNHFNSFVKAEYNYIYKAIEDEDIDNVLGCLRKWDSIHDNEESVVSEYSAVIYALANRERLNIKTGCIYIDGVLEAFIIGSPLKHQTIQIHVEKANKDIRGLYVAICKFFLEQNFSEFLYVNREEDMGIENLRKAKKALHPIKMVTKYRIEENAITIRKASSQDEQVIRDLWLENFSDENEQTTDFYFSTCYNKEHIFVLTNQETIASVVQIVPYDIIEQSKQKRVFFVLGVCTRLDYQGNGIMKQLLKDILCKEPYKDTTIFLQAYQPEIYRSLGFNKKYHHQYIKVQQDAYNKDIAITMKKDVDPQVLVDSYITFCQSFEGYRIRTLEYYTKYLYQRIKAYDEQLVGLYDGNEYLGYVIYTENELKITIKECIYQSIDGLDKIISHFATKEKDLYVECDMKATIIGDKEMVCTMMTNDIDEDTIMENYYINEEL